MKKTLVKVAVKDLKVGDKVYSFQDKSYDIIMKIEFQNHLGDTPQALITWKAFNKGTPPLEVETKGFSTYLPLDTICHIVKEEEGEDAGDIIIDTPMWFIEVGNKVYIEEIDKVIEVSYLSPKEDNMGVPASFVELYWFESINDEKHLTFDASRVLKLHLKPEDLKQSVQR